jgi:hypothetical protein
MLLEIHYDNPKEIKNIVDDSGVKLYFTRQLRQHDLGLLTLGTEGTASSLQIPPKSNDFISSSICDSFCTNVRKST